MRAAEFAVARDIFSFTVCTKCRAPKFRRRIAMKSNSLFLRLFLLGAALMAAPALSSAQTTEVGGNVYMMSGLINFTRGQAVGIHFCNVAREPAYARMYFVDADGSVLKSASARVFPGKTMSISFSFSELPRSSPIRVGVRGVVVLAQPPDPDVQPPEPDLALANMDVFDVLTGKTSFGLLVPAVRSLNVYFPTDQ